MSNISTSFVSMLYNMQLLRMLGEDGVSAYGVLMYVQLIFIGTAIGYSIGSAPPSGWPSPCCASGLSAPCCIP